MPGAWQLLMVALPASQTSFEKLSFSNPFSQYANGGIPGWQYGGATTLAEDYVRLTPAAVDTVGYMWSEQTVDATSDWELQLEFHIGGPAERGAGGGLALWLTSNKRAPMDGALYGHGDEFDGLGVFFDTHEAGEGDPANDKQPFVVAMVNHGSKAARVSNQVRLQSRAAALITDASGLLSQPPALPLSLSRGRARARARARARRRPCPTRRAAHAPACAARPNASRSSASASPPTATASTR